MKLAYPLRYYLRQQWVDVGGVRVPYTPANETTFRLAKDGVTVADLTVIGGYALVVAPGYDLETLREKYAGEAT
jgi:hypothetical protein